MANHFPVSQDGQVIQVTYQLTPGNNMAMFGNPAWVAQIPSEFGIALLVFSFTWGYDATGGALTVDYGQFDQDTAEAAVVSLLNAMAANLGLDLPAWQSVIKVTRQWMFKPATQTGIVVPTATDTMPYTAS